MTEGQAPSTQPGDPAGETERRLAREESAASRLQGERPAWQRALWALLGLGFVGVGAVGVVVPGLPTTPLLLLAAACFARSSPRLYAWLLRNKTFGPLIEDYRAGRGVSARVKGTAIGMMSAFVAFAILVPLREKPIPAALVLALAIAGAVYILRLPTRPREAA